MAKKKNETITETVQKQKVYEISMILVPTFDDSTVLEKMSQIKQSVASMSSFISEETPFIRSLSYTMTRVIKNVNTRFNEGYYTWIKLEAGVSDISKIDSILKQDEDIIRYIIVSADKDEAIMIKDNLPDGEVFVPSEEEVSDIDTTVLGEAEVLPEDIIEAVEDTDTVLVSEDKTENK